MANQIIVFQHTAARRRLRTCGLITEKIIEGFQHTAARRRLPTQLVPLSMSLIVSTHSRAEAAAGDNLTGQGEGDDVSTHSRAEAAAKQEEDRYNKRIVSTHSRAEAAAIDHIKRSHGESCFNTQPRGGGCTWRPRLLGVRRSFNTQPRGGGCTHLFLIRNQDLVSTHSRAEAAADRHHRQDNNK